MPLPVAVFDTPVISSPDRVLAVRGQKKGGRGRRKEEMRSGKIRIETSADWLFHNARESSTRVYISCAQGAKNKPMKLYRTKKIKVIQPK